MSVEHHTASLCLYTDLNMYVEGRHDFNGRWTYRALVSIVSVLFKVQSLKNDRESNKEEEAQVEAQVEA